MNASKISTPVSLKSPSQQRPIASGRKSAKISNGGGAPSIQSRSPCGSPKRSPKLVRAAPGTTELKDYGPIDHRAANKYPPHAYPASGKGNFKPRVDVQQQIPGPNFSKVSNLGQSGLQRPAMYQNNPGQMYSQVMKPIAKPIKEPQHQPSESTEMSPEQLRGYSLPRPKRDDSCPSNIAVVSPMPSSSSASKIGDSIHFSPLKASTPMKGREDAPKNQVQTPMPPIGPNLNPDKTPSRQQHFPSTSTLNMPVLSGEFLF